jgi:hypothetical protein
MENTANLGLLAVNKIVSEYAKRIYAYMAKTPRDTKLLIKKILSIFTLWDELSLKTISRCCSFNRLSTYIVGGDLAHPEDSGSGWYEVPTQVHINLEKNSTSQFRSS